MLARRTVWSVKFSTPRRMRVCTTPTPPPPHLHRSRHSIYPTMRRTIATQHTPRRVLLLLRSLLRENLGEPYIERRWWTKLNVRLTSPRWYYHIVYNIVCARRDDGGRCAREENAPPNSVFVCGYARRVRITCLRIGIRERTSRFRARWNITIYYAAYICAPCNLEKTLRLGRFF